MTILKLKQELIDLIRARNTERISLFVEEHPNFRDSNGNNILHILTLYAPTQIVEKFLNQERVQSLLEKNKQGYTVGDLAAKLHRAEVIEIIKNLGQELSPPASDDPSFSSFWKIFNAIINDDLEEALNTPLSGDFRSSKDLSNNLILSLYSTNIHYSYLYYNRSYRSALHPLLIFHFLTIVGPDKLINDFLTKQLILDREIAYLFTSTIMSSNPRDTSLLKIALNIANDNQISANNPRLLSMEELTESLSYILQESPQTLTYEFAETLIELYANHNLNEILKAIQGSAVVADNYKVLKWLFQNSKITIGNIIKEHYVINFNKKTFSYNLVKLYKNYYLNDPKQSTIQKQLLINQVQQYVEEYKLRSNDYSTSLNLNIFKLLSDFFDDGKPKNNRGETFFSLILQAEPQSLLLNMDIHNFIDSLIYDGSGYYTYYKYLQTIKEIENNYYSGFISRYSDLNKIELNKIELLKNTLKTFIVTDKTNKKLPLTSNEKVFYNSYYYQEALDSLQHRKNVETLKLYLEESRFEGLTFKAEKQFKDSHLFNQNLIEALNAAFNKIAKKLNDNTNRIIASYLNNEELLNLINLTDQKPLELITDADQFLNKDFYSSFETLRYNAYLPIKHIITSLYTYLSEPKGNKAGNNHLYNFTHTDLWYTVDQIESLLGHNFSDNPNIFIVSHNQQGHTLASNINVAISHAAEGRIAVLPILVNNNHWVSLIIREEPGNPGHYEGIFVDSLGHPASDYNLHSELPNSNFRLVEANMQQQTNGDDCGVWTVDNIINIVNYLQQHNEPITQEVLHNIINSDTNVASDLRQTQANTLASFELWGSNTEDTHSNFEEYIPHHVMDFDTHSTNYDYYATDYVITTSLGLLYSHIKLHLD